MSWNITVKFTTQNEYASTSVLNNSVIFDHLPLTIFTMGLITYESSLKKNMVIDKIIFLGLSLDFIWNSCHFLLKINSVHVWLLNI